MRTRLTLFLGIFAVMALSNAIVPVLPVYDAGSSMQGMIYSAYFLGAFMVTLPAGILSDRFGRVPFIRLGLAISVASGIFLSMSSGAIPVLILRLIEGAGAGLFVAAALSSVNSDPDHVPMSGWFMAFMNCGFVAGLLISGWLASVLDDPASGILLFALITVIPAVSSFFVKETADPAVGQESGTVIEYVVQYRWLWYSSLVLVGITGVLTSLYPEFSDASPDVVGLWIAGMSVATIAAVLIYSRTPVHPVPVIRWSAVLVGAAVIVSFFSAAGFLIVGALAGVVMIAQMAFLAGIRGHQGIVMGLFSTTSYLGMALLPVSAGFVADGLGFFMAFCITALCAGTVAVTIGRCECDHSIGNGPGHAGIFKEQ